MKNIRRFRRFLAHTLFAVADVMMAFGDRICYLSGLLMAKSAKLLAIPTLEPVVSPFQDKLRCASIDGWLENIRDYPCKICEGIGAVLVHDDDAVACPACKGTRIDPAYIAAPVKL